MPGALAQGTMRKHVPTTTSKPLPHKLLLSKPLPKLPPTTDMLAAFPVPPQNTVSSFASEHSAQERVVQFVAGTKSPLSKQEAYYTGLSHTFSGANAPQHLGTAIVPAPLQFNVARKPVIINADTAASHVQTVGRNNSGIPFNPAASAGRAAAGKLATGVPASNMSRKPVTAKAPATYKAFPSTVRTTASNPKPTVAAGPIHSSAMSKSTNWGNIQTASTGATAPTTGVGAAYVASRGGKKSKKARPESRSDSQSSHQSAWSALSKASIRSIRSLGSKVSRMVSAGLRKGDEYVEDSRARATQAWMEKQAADAWEHEQRAKAEADALKAQIGRPMDGGNVWPVDMYERAREVELARRAEAARQKPIVARQMIPDGSWRNTTVNDFYSKKQTDAPFAMAITPKLSPPASKTKVIPQINTKVKPAQAGKSGLLSASAGELMDKLRHAGRRDSDKSFGCIGLTEEEVERDIAESKAAAEIASRCSHRHEDPLRNRCTTCKFSRRLR